MSLTFAGRFGPEPVTNARGDALDGAVVTVYESDGVTKATLYDGKLKAATASNPLTLGGDGLLGFWAVPGQYVVKVVWRGRLYRNETVTVGAHPDDLDVVPLTANQNEVVTGDWNFTGGIQENGTALSATYRMLDVANVKHSDFGAVGDGVADDTAAIQAAIDSFGTAATYSAGRVFLPRGTYRITSTLLIERKSLVFEGEGWGDDDGSGTVIKWDGAAGSPMLRLHRCRGSVVRRLVLAGHPTNTPSAGVSMYQLSADGLPNSFNILEQLQIGDYSFITGGDTPVEVGIDFEGNNLNNDKNLVQLCRIEGCTTAGIRVGNTQSVLNNIRGCILNNCAIGVESHADIYMENMLFTGSTAEDIRLGSSAEAYIDYMHSENAARLLVMVDAGTSAIFNGGLYQIDDNLNPNDYFVVSTANTNQDLEFHNFHFDTTGYTRGGTPVLHFKAAAGGAATKVLVLDNCTGLTVSNLDVATVTASDKRTVLGSTGGKKFRNVLSFSGLNTVDFDRYDFDTNTTVRIGTARIKSGTGTPEGAVTAPPGSLFLRTDGGASTTMYVKESGTGNTGWVAK